MVYYKNFYVSSVYINNFINEYAVFGWRLHSKNVIRFTNNIRPFGPYNYKSEGKTIYELTFIYDDNNGNKELKKLSDEYIDLKEKQLKASYITYAGLSAGIVFSSLFLFAGLFIFTSKDYQWLFIAFLINGALGLALSIWGIIFRSKNQKKAYSDINEKLKTLMRDAQQIAK